MIKWLKQQAYRWRTRKTWWVVTWQLLDRGAVRQSGYFASLAETREDAEKDAAECILDQAVYNGDVRYMVRRPNLIDLFLR